MDIDVTRMTSKGQIVIPQDIRDHMGIEEGERFLVYDDQDTIIFKRVKSLRASKDMKSFRKTFSSMWETAKKRGLTRENAAQEISAHRKGK